MAARTAADRGRKVRERLLRAATELIAERGWNAVTTRILAERAGVTVGLVHYHFASLQALLRAAATDTIRRTAGQLGDLLDQASTPDEVVALLLGALDQYTGHDPTSLVFSEAYLAATRDDVLRAELAGVLEDVGRRLTRWLYEQGVAEPTATAAVVSAAVDGLMLHRALDPGLTAEAAEPVLRRLLATDKAEKTGGPQ